MTIMNTSAGILPLRRPCKALAGRRLKGSTEDPFEFPELLLAQAGGGKAVLIWAVWQNDQLISVVL